MDAGEVARPPKPEKGYWETHSSKTGRRKLFFRAKIAVRVDMFGLKAKFPIEVPGKSNANCSYQNTKECQAVLSGIKAVFFFKDDWKGFEKNIQNSVDKGDVKVH